MLHLSNDLIGFLETVCVGLILIQFLLLFVFSCPVIRPLLSLPGSKLGRVTHLFHHVAVFLLTVNHDGRILAVADVASKDVADRAGHLIPVLGSLKINLHYLPRSDTITHTPLHLAYRLDYGFVLLADARYV